MSPFLKNEPHIRSDTHEGGYILFLLMVIGTLLFIFIFTSLFEVKNSLKIAGVTRVHDAAFNIAEAGKENGLANLRADSVLLDSIVNNYKVILQNVSFENGNYSVQCRANATKDTISLLSTGTVGTESVTIEITCLRFDTFLSRFVAAVTTLSKDTIVGDITINGNDTNTLTNTTGSGVYGVYSFDSCYFKNSLTHPTYPEVAGNGNPLPGLAGWGNGSLLQSTDTAHFPHNPEEVVGVSSGFFNSYKNNKTISPVLNINNEIAYLTTFNSPGSIVLSGSGILICHNDADTATLKNIHGTFKGLIIADRIINLTTDAKIIGAVYTLSSLSRSKLSGQSWNKFGGNGSPPTPMIRYSSQVLKSIKTLIKWNYVVVKALSWKEL
jgi:hypothetical protein